MGPHKNLLVWKKSMELTSEIYKVTRSFPREELFGLVSQMRRCVVSIPSNIAEGYGRSSNAEIVHFLHNSLGSSNELDTQLIISFNEGFLSAEDYERINSINEEVNKMLISLIYKRSN